MTSVGVINYGMGNLRSVRNALESLGATVAIVDSAEALHAFDRAILPGVGAFGDAMKNLGAAGWREAIRRYAQAGRPFLGICLGMQLLAERGTEHGDNEGLGLIAGTVRKLTPPVTVRIPHIGWNEVRPAADTRLLARGPSECFYFVHSYAFAPSDAAVATGFTEYGGVEFASVVEQGNVMGTQFHPEKSQKAGIQLLTRFLAL